jgi:AraC family transcriptional regulator of adaptative response/methylated-DNA-[protein]-cysteine methyltransferase
MIKDRDYRRVERAIHWIRENADRQPDLSAMAAAADLSPHHFSRLFRRWAGIPPHQFLRTVTLDAAKTRLKRDGDLLGVAIDVGLSGPGRLHDLFVLPHCTDRPGYLLPAFRRRRPGIRRI